MIAMIVMLGIAALAAAALVPGAREGELAEKRAWAALQGAEYRDRGSTATGPILISARGFRLLGVPGVGRPDVGLTQPPASRRSWLILNEHSRTGVRQLNTYPAYDLQCGYVETLKAKVPDVDEYAIKHLRGICMKESA